MRKTSSTLAVLLVAAVLQLAPETASAQNMTSPHAASNSDGQRGALVVRDRRGDGRPDVTYLKASDIGQIRVTMRFRNVRQGPGYNAAVMYVDPTGRKKKPLYALSISLDAATGYRVVYTHGWRLTNRNVTCGLTARLGTPSRTGRIVRVTMPRACFGDSGARFAVKAVRGSRTGAQLDSDWLPRKKTLTRRFGL